MLPIWAVTAFAAPLSTLPWEPRDGAGRDYPLADLATVGAGVYHLAHSNVVEQPSPQPLTEMAPTDADPASSAMVVTADTVGRILLSATIARQGPFHFIVDTGANHTAVSPRLAAQLGLQPVSQQRRLNGLTGVEATSRFVRLPDITAGAFHRSDVSAVIVEPRVLAGADGVLGADLLQGMRLAFDFKQRLVRIEPSRGRLRKTGDRIISRATLTQGGLISVQGVVSGVRVRAILDTGAQNTLGNQALLEAIPERRRQRWADGEVALLGVTDHVATAVAARVPRVRLGRALVRHAWVFFGDLHVFHAWDLRDEPALLVGMDILGASDGLTIDYATSQVVIDPIRQPGFRVRMGTGRF